MFISPAYAQTAAAGGSSTMATIVQFAPFILMGLVFYFLLYRPQQLEQKALKARLAAVKRGDKVVTAGGIVGLVKKAADGVAEIDVEIAPNVTVSVIRSTITQIIAEKA
jgi:preprotein translocase subunit YajC